MKLVSFLLVIFICSCATTPKSSKLSQVVCSDMNKRKEFIYTPHYSEDFQKAIPADQMAHLYHEVIKQYGECREVIDYSKNASGDSFSLKHASGKIIDLSMVQKDEVITGLWLLGERPEPITYSDWQDVEEDFKQYSDARLLLRHEGKDTVSINPHKRTPLGSIFKIFILDALNQEIKKGKHQWNDQLSIKASWKSLPSGRMQDEADGTQFDLKKYASLMISISDNTATDHLFYLLGRGSIEKQIKQRKLKKTYSWNRPFLNTMELFRVRAFFSPSDYKAYAGATRTNRLLQIQKLPQATHADFLPSIGRWQEPRGLYDVEWFSTPAEVCQLMSSFQNENESEIVEVLSLNTPFVDKDKFEQVLYKGGSEPGLVQMAYYFTHNDKPICLYAGVINRSQAVDERKFFEQVKGIINLLLAQKSSSE